MSAARPAANIASRESPNSSAPTGASAQDSHPPLWVQHEQADIIEVEAGTDQVNHALHQQVAVQDGGSVATDFDCRLELV
jgi:hypothetical protein